MHIHEISKIAADPCGAALITIGTLPPVGGLSGCLGKWGTRCFATPIGPTPGPPPPCGMQNVLCRFRWHTSAPMVAGLVTPPLALRLARSIYTWPPCEWTILQISRIEASNTPCVLGYVTISAARVFECFSA